MGATIMPSMRSTIRKLRADYPEFQFEPADMFWWSSAKNTVFYDEKDPNGIFLLLHELSHAVLGHKGYEKDIQLLQLERDAWDYAKNTLSLRYDIKVHDDTSQRHLDTYREWLHARSTCPNCEATGIQIRGGNYRCFACGHIWRANEARLCELRRYSITTK